MWKCCSSLKPRGHSLDLVQWPPYKYPLFSIRQVLFLLYQEYLTDFSQWVFHVFVARLLYHTFSWGNWVCFLVIILTFYTTDQFFLCCCSDCFEFQNREFFESLGIVHFLPGFWCSTNCGLYLRLSWLFLWYWLTLNHHLHLFCT